MRRQRKIRLVKSYYTHILYVHVDKYNTYHARTQFFFFTFSFYSFCFIISYQDVHTWRIHTHGEAHAIGLRLNCLNTHTHTWDTKRWAALYKISCYRLAGHDETKKRKSDKRCDFRDNVGKHESASLLVRGGVVNRTEGFVAEKL